MKRNLQSEKREFNKKKIGFLINNMSLGGGTERVTSIIASELVENEYDIYILSCKECKETQFELNKNIKVLSLTGSDHDNSIIRKIKIIKNLNAFIDKFEINILIAVDTSLYLYLLFIKILNNSRRNIRTISWEHFNFYSKRSFLGKISQVASAKYADAVIVLGLQDKENYIKNIKNIKNIDCIYNPITIDADKKSLLNNKTVLAVGRLTKQKGFDMLIEAWSYVQKEQKDWCLKIVGSGPEEENLKNQIEKQNINNIEIIPFQKNIEEYYLNSSIFTLSSRYEGFGLVLLEAQLKGLPIVSFKCKEGPEEIVDDGVNGYLVECNNVKKLADRLLDLIKNEDLRISFGENSQKDLEKFEKNKIIDKWIKLFESLYRGKNEKVSD